MILSRGRSVGTMQVQQLRRSVPAGARLPRGVAMRRAHSLMCSATKPAALLWDCDGVLVDTEKDGHRVAFNKAFAARGGWWKSVHI